jgi:hypothetical protein
LFQLSIYLVNFRIVPNPAIIKSFK